MPFVHLWLIVCGILELLFWCWVMYVGFGVLRAVSVNLVYVLVVGAGVGVAYD